MNKHGRNQRHTRLAALGAMVLLAAAMAPSARAQTTGLPAPLAVNQPNGVAGLDAQGHLPTSLQGGKQLYEYLVTGDSYAFGTGATRLGNAASYLVMQDTPALYKANVAVGGTHAGEVSVQTLNNWTPDPNQKQPGVLYVQDGGNDAAADTCSSAASSNCITNFIRSYEGIAGWAAGAPQNRIMASAATMTGTWQVNNAIVIPATAYNGGTAMNTTGAGQTMTFTIPATNNGHIGLYQTTINGGTSPYTVSINGVLQTESCSGTTTFTNGPCGGTAMPYSPSNQRFDFYNAAWAGNPVTVVISASSSASFAITAVDWVPQGGLPANANAVFAMTLGGASGDSTGVYSAAVQTAIGNLAGVGYQAYVVDERALFATLPSNGTANSMYNGHPNDAAYFALYQKFLATEAADNFVFTCMDCGGYHGVNQGYIPGPLTTNLGYYATHGVGDLYNNWNLKNVLGAGDILFNNGSNALTGRRISNGTVADGTTGRGYQAVYGNSNTAAFGYWCTQSIDTQYVGTETNFLTSACIRFSTGDFFSKGYLRGAFTATAVGSAIASAAMIAPVTGVVHITGTAAISTMTPPAGCTSTGTACTVRLIPDGAFTTVTGGGTGGFALASTAVVNRVLEMTYDPATGLWYPSY